MVAVDRRKSSRAGTPPQETESDSPESDESDIHSDSEISDGPCPCSSPQQSDSEDDAR